MQSLRGGAGYWFIVDEAFDFTYNPPQSVLSRNDYELSESLISDKSFEYSQSSEQAFYFIRNIEGAVEGDWIIAYNGDIVVGSRKWNGEYTDVPTMGYDSNLYSAGYCETGDDVQFKLYKADSGELLNLFSEQNIDSWSPNAMVTVNSMSSIEIPLNVSLLSAYPNPFNPSTEVQITLPYTSNVIIDVVNMQG